MTEAHQLMKDAAVTGAAASPGALVWLAWEWLAHLNIQNVVGLFTVVYLVVQIIWRLANWRERPVRAPGRTEADE